MNRSDTLATAAHEAESLPTSEAEADAVVDNILRLLSDERFQTARRVAREAIDRFPEHPRVRNAWRIFDTRANAIRRPGNEPSRSEEFNWLRNPPETARGKWVALVGKEMVAAADSLKELVESIRSLRLSSPPLVHHLD